MAIQRLHAFEKTAVQLRHTIKRLEMFIDIERNEGNKALAEEMLRKAKDLRNIIPKEYRDVDLNKKE
jgi:hypothetical protein